MWRLHAALALTLLAAPAAAGQTRPAPQQTEAMQRANARVEKHIATLHTRLAITPAQEPQWAAFAEIMRENTRRMEIAWAAHQAKPPENAVAGLKTYAALEHARVEDVERLIPPFEDLYKTLTPDQRTTADKTFRDFQTTRHAHSGA